MTIAKTIAADKLIKEMQDLIKKYNPSEDAEGFSDGLLIGLEAIVNSIDNNSPYLNKFYQNLICGVNFFI